MKKLIAGTVAALLAVNLAGLAATGWKIGWGPFAKLHDVRQGNLPGNSAPYSVENAGTVPGSPLQGKTVLFLGSSVTYGAASLGVSFADFIAARNDCTMIKGAVSGTTLADDKNNSYVSRLKNVQADKVDLLVCQLSTNDATQKKPLGEIGTARDLNVFDTSTVAGALEYIICYAQQKWNCPVVIYTNPRYDSEAYAAMVALLPQLEEKWGVTTIDLWNDAAFNDITAEQRSLYMDDAIHPTKAGYLEWWVPVMEPTLYKVIEKSRRAGVKSHAEQ